MKHKLLFLLMLALPSYTWAQDIKISGTVIAAADGEALPMATVVEAGTTNGTTTDFEGHYTITLKKAAKLQFAFMGCKTKEVAVSHSGTVDVTLEDDVNLLDEVVAVGYGSMRRSDLTGAVAVVKAGDLQKTPAASVDQALQGRAAGVTVNASSGQPGQAAEIRIRGIGTVNDASPIFVVDGVICNDISFLSPSDIESTEVLKDASATAIYGSRGANGVILVTTKKGEKGQAHVSFDMYYGWQNRWKKLELLGRDEFVEAYLQLGATQADRNYYASNGFNEWLQRRKFGNVNDYAVALTQRYDDGIDYSKVNTDWQDEVFRSNAVIQNYHASIDGGTDKSNYSFSASYFDQDGTLIGTDFQRLTLRANTSFQVKPWMKVGENLSFVHSTGTVGLAQNAESPNASVLSAALAMAPWDPARLPQGAHSIDGTDLSGNLAAPSNFRNAKNPLGMVAFSHPKNVTTRWIGDVYAEFTPFKGFSYRTDFSYDDVVYNHRSFDEAYYISSNDKRDKNFIDRSLTHYTTFTWENILNYNTRINDTHGINVMLGQTTEEYNYYGIGGSGAKITNPVEKNWFLNQATEDQSKAGDNVDRTRRLSFLGRLHYTLKDRYMATFNFRADGSNRFPENTWGYFPSVALAWRLNEEPWMQQFKSLDYLKLRGGWGQIGNDKVANNTFVTTVMTGSDVFVAYPLGSVQALQPGTTIMTVANTGGKWERTESLNFGVDFAFARGLISGSIDIFKRDTKDMLLSITGPAYSGNHWSGTANVGTVSNKGIELTLAHTRSIRGFKYNIDANLSYIKNELTELNGGEPIYDTYTVCDKGMALYTFYGLEYRGVYKTQEEADAAMWGYAQNGLANPYGAGDAIYVDRDGNGMIDDNDRTTLGNNFPKFTYGFNISAEWKGFDLSLFFQGVSGNKIYNALRKRTEGDGTQCQLSTAMRNVWSEDNINGTIPNPKNSINSDMPSSRFIESGAYLRLKNLQLGYTLPKSLVAPAGIQRCRVYASMSNVFTLTNYGGYDPEVGSGIDFGNYPQARTFLMGIQMSF